MLERQIRTKTTALPIERKSVTTSLSILEKRIEEDDIPDDDVASFEFQTTSFVEQQKPNLKSILGSSATATGHHHSRVASLGPGTSH